MNPNTPDTPTDAIPASTEDTHPLATETVDPVSTETPIEPTVSLVGDATQEITSPEVILTSTFDTIESNVIADPVLTTIEPATVIESIQNNTVIDPASAMESAPIVESLPAEFTPVAVSNPAEVAPNVPVAETTNPPIVENTPDTPKKGKGLFLGTLGALGLVMLSCVGFAGYTYYERVTHPDWTASEIGVFIRDGVIDSLASHAMVLSGSEPTFTTINTTYTLSGEGKGLETVGFKNANATLNMSGSAYMEPMTASGSLPVFDGSFTMTLSLEGSGDKGMKGSLAIGVDAKSTGDTTLYIRPNNIKLVAPEIAEQLGQEIPVAQIESSVDELNKTYLGKWYRLNTESYQMDMIDVFNEIDPAIYSLNMKESALEMMEQQKADTKKLEDHLKKVGAIFNKYHILTGEAHPKSWKSYFKSEPITYTASINKEETKKFLKEFSKWISEVPVNSLYGTTFGEMSNLFGISNSDELIDNLINNLDLSMTLVSDSKKQGSIKLNQLDMGMGQGKDRITLHLQDLLQTKVERNNDIITVHKNGSICGMQITQSGSRKGICETDELKDSIMFNAVYSGNAEFVPKNLSFSGNIDVFPYDYEKKNFNDKAAHITIDTQVVTNENTANKFSQKMNFNVGANLEKADTKVKFSLDVSQTTEKVAKRAINPVSESIDIMTTLKNFLIWAKTMDEQQKSDELSVSKTQIAGDISTVAYMRSFKLLIEIYFADMAVLPESSNGCMLNTTILNSLTAQPETLNILSTCEVKYGKINEKEFYLLGKVDKNDDANLFLTNEEFQNFTMIRNSELASFVEKHGTQIGGNQSGYYYLTNNNH